MAELLQTLKQRFFTDNGEPLAGGKLYSYIAGTTTPLATFTDRGATTPHTNPIELDANGEAEVWVNPNRLYKFVLTDADDVEIWSIDQVKTPSGGGGGGSLPSGGLEGAALVKLSDEDGDADWVSFSYSGYSARFNAQFDSTSLDDTLRKIINLQYTAPTISLSASGSGTLREKGDPVTATTLTASVGKRSDPIAQVRFYRNPSTLLDTQNSGGAIPNGGNSTFGWTGSFTDNTTFKAEADDNGATGGPSTVSATATFSFVYPYYTKNAAPGLADSSVSGLDKLIMNSNANFTRIYTASAGDVFYFKYPASYGALTKIFDVNNFDTFADWTATTVNITGLDGNAVSYRVYKFNNPVVAGSYQFTFVR